MDIQLTPEALVPDDKKLIVEKIKEVEKVVYKDKEVPVERIIEKPVIVDRETVKVVTDVQTDNFHKLLADLHTSVEQSKRLVKESLDQMKYIASDPQKLDKVLETMNGSTRDLSASITSVKNIFYENAEKINQSFIKFQNDFQIQTEKSKPRDLTQDIEAITRAINDVRSTTQAIDKFKGIQEYLVILKSAIDKIDVKPEVKVTTQKIEDTLTQQKVDTLSALVKSSQEGLDKFFKGVEHRLILLESQVQSGIPTVIKNSEELLTASEKFANSVTKNFLAQLESYDLNQKIADKIIKYLNEDQSRLRTTTTDLFAHIESKLDSILESSRLDFERVVNQKIFDITLELNKTIPSIVQKELNEYMNKLQVSPVVEKIVDSREEPNALSMFEFLGSIKSIIQSELTSKSKTPIVVPTWKELKNLEGVVNLEACVLKYGILRRPKWFRWVPSVGWV